MISFESIRAQLNPDLARVFRRFPVAILGAVVLTALALLSTFEVWALNEETLGRSAFAALNLSVFGVAGQMIWEAGRLQRSTRLGFRYLLPVLAALSATLPDHRWMMAELLPIIGGLLLSVGPFVGRAKPVNGQDEFWWMNHRAIISGAVAGIAIGLIYGGLLIIHWSMDFLFGLDLSDITFRFLMPVTALLLAPIYWFSTIPRFDEFDAAELEQPDFLSRAVGFLGVYVLSPLLLAYALILLSYAAQIVMTGTWPKGVLGWMVLAFATTGAANILVLYPAFMRRRPVVRLFTRIWFWLTLVPIALYFVAVWLRIDAYGLTEERIALIGGGVWALALAICFISRRLADIRLVPGLALIVFLGLSFGPQNAINWAQNDQLSRLHSSIAALATDLSAEDRQVQENAARSALSFLADMGEGQQKLIAAFPSSGLSERMVETELRAALSIPDEAGTIAVDERSLLRDLRANPLVMDRDTRLFGRIIIGHYEQQYDVALKLMTDGTKIIAVAADDVRQIIDLGQWLSLEEPELDGMPPLLINTAQGQVRLVAAEAHLTRRDGMWSLDYLDSYILAD